MKFEVIPAQRTRDRKMDRLIISMTEKEAAKVLKDIVNDAWMKSSPTWFLMLGLKDYFDGKLEIATGAVDEK